MVAKLHRESKSQCFENIQTSKNSKPFWDKCKPYFSTKHARGDSKIILNEKENIITNKNKPYFSTKNDHGDSKIILIEKENIITNKNEVLQKETLLVHNDEIAKTLNN